MKSGLSILGVLDLSPGVDSVLHVFAVIPQLCDNNNGGCKHFCNVVDGSVECSCADGYFLDADDKSCKSHRKSLVPRRSLIL